MRSGAPPTRRRFVVLAVATLAASLSACGVGSAVTDWQRLQAWPPARVLAADRTAIRAIHPIALRTGDSATVRIGHADAVVSVDGVVSYGKLFRLQGHTPGSYDIRVDTWCDCPWTAIMWGTATFPIVYPHVTVLEDSGERLLVTGEVEHLDPSVTWNTTARLRGHWRVNLPQKGPYYVLVTSAHAGSTPAGHLGGNLGQSLTSSPVGKIMLRVSAAG